MLSTPILNPPQTGILGMHNIQERAVVRDGQIVVAPMMYLALSYDHRLIDGREAVQFLVRIKDCLEAPERMLWRFDERQSASVPPPDHRGGHCQSEIGPGKPRVPSGFGSAGGPVGVLTDGYLRKMQRMATGTVKWFNDSKGFGFIVQDGGGEDVFCHHTSIQMDGFRTLAEGQKVVFDLTKGPKGLQAQNVKAA